jgi:hypothetical protein
MQYTPDLQVCGVYTHTSSRQGSSLHLDTPAPLQPPNLASSPSACTTKDMLVECGLTSCDPRSLDGVRF